MRHSEFESPQQYFSNIINYSLFKSETEFTLFSKIGSAGFLDLIVSFLSADNGKQKKIVLLRK